MKLWVAAVIAPLLAALMLPLAAAAEVPKLTLQEMRAKWALPNSQYVELDGVNVHYVDEGEGPTIVLLHASYLGLRAWDSLAAALKTSHRVVRLDLVNAGATGPDTHQLNSIERNNDLLERLVAHLGLERFSVLGTSSGGIVAFRYAAAHPERVERLILVNSAGLPRTPETDPFGAQGSARRAALAEPDKTRDYWAGTLAGNFKGGHTPPDWLVDYAYDASRREGLGEEYRRFMAAFQTGDPEAVLAQVRAPTLIVWGMDNPTVMHLQADVFRLWLTGAPSMIRKFPAAGHYLYIETPSAFDGLIGEFLAGRLDSTLRRVTLVPID